MASIRISAALRDHVVAGLLRHRFNVEELELREDISWEKYDHAAVPKISIKGKIFYPEGARGV